MNKSVLFLAMLIAGVLVSASFAESRPVIGVEDMVRMEAVRQGVPVSLALSIARHESGFRCSAVGRHGERGVMQIKPSTARSLGYRGPASGLNNCSTGIRYGMIYLRQAYKISGGNSYKAAVLYNGGLGTKRKKSAYAEKITKRQVNSRRSGSNQERRYRSVYDYLSKR